MTDLLVERLAVDELQDDRGRAVGLLETVNAGDVRMVERGEELGLALEPAETIGVAREFAGQHFQRDVALQLRVARTVDLAHAAGAEQLDDFVRCDPRTGFKWHGRPGTETLA